MKVYAAHGIGRSYGIEAGILGMKVPGILQCGLLDALEDAKNADKTSAVLALITDIGNDIMYCVAPDVLTDWVTQVINRLSQLEATIVVTSVPLEGILSIPSWQFHLFRTLFYPRRPMPRNTVASRLAELQCGLWKRWLAHQE